MRILAHRGAPGRDGTENTARAVGAALAAGADGVEIDLRLTADGVLAACHDADLLRLTGRDLPVATTSWSVLRRAAGRAGVALAQLDDVLRAAAGRPVVLELKPGPVDAAHALVERLCHLRDEGAPFDVTVSSFDPTLVATVRVAGPADLRVRTALLGRPGCLALATARQALLDGHDQVHPHVSDLLADPGAAVEVAATGLEVVPWTVNSGRMIRRCAELGVAAVITDVPRKARAAATLRSVAA